MRPAVFSAASSYPDGSGRQWLAAMQFSSHSYCSPPGGWARAVCDRRFCPVRGDVLRDCRSACIDQRQRVAVAFVARAGSANPYRSNGPARCSRSGARHSGCTRHLFHCHRADYMGRAMSVPLRVAPRGPLPDDADVYRSIGPFDAQSVPRGLLGKHDLKPGAWARLCVTAGSVRFVWDDSAGGSELLTAGVEMIVPPCVPHHLELCGPLEFTIHFCAET